LRRQLLIALSPAFTLFPVPLLVGSQALSDGALKGFLALRVAHAPADGDCVPARHAEDLRDLGRGLLVALWLGQSCVVAANHRFLPPNKASDPFRCPAPWKSIVEAPRNLPPGDATRAKSHRAKIKIP
jgi:hypothetical protein